MKGVRLCCHFGPGFFPVSATRWTRPVDVGKNTKSTNIFQKENSNTLHSLCNNYCCYSQITNRRGEGVYWFFKIFLPIPTPRSLLGPPRINSHDKSFWSGRFYYWLAVFPILWNKKRLIDSYLKHFDLTLFIEKSYQL